MDLLELAIEKGLEPNKTSNRDGGEYHCACPNPHCDADEDGFAIWPSSAADKCTGRFWCRKCDVKGDTIEFLRSFCGMSWKEACAALKVDLQEFQSFNGYVVKKPERALKVASPPASLWQEKASVFVDWCHQKLLRNKQALQQVMQRGFTLESIKQFKLGFCPMDFWRKCEEWGIQNEADTDEFRLHRGLTIPWFDSSGNALQVKVRKDTYEVEIEEYEKRLSQGEKPKWKPQKYLYVRGSMKCPATFGDSSLNAGILVESEFDALLLQQQAGDLVFAIANGGSRKPLDASTDHLIRKTQKILLCPDDDNGGDFLQNLLEVYQNMILWPAPIGKSPGDALKYHRIDLRSWIIQGIYSDN
jgi:DNA primase